MNFDFFYIFKKLKMTIIKHPTKGYLTKNENGEYIQFDYKIVSKNELDLFFALGKTRRMQWEREFLKWKKKNEEKLNTFHYKYFSNIDFDEFSKIIYKNKIILY